MPAPQSKCRKIQYIDHRWAKLCLFELYATRDHYNYESFSPTLGLKVSYFFLRGRFRSDRAIAERGLPVILRHARARTLLAAMINRSQPQNAALFLCLACIGALPALAGVNVLCCNVPLHNVRRVAGRPDVKITILCIPLNLGIVVLNCLLISLPKRKQSCHVLRKDVIGWGESSVV